MKYKVGDRVRVRRDLKALKAYCSEDKKYGQTAISDMLEMRGKVVTIKNACPLNGAYEIKEFNWLWTDEMFEDIHNEKIVITTDGTTTTAKLYNGKEVINSAEAKCSPEDEFDFERGAGIAISRLLDWDFIADEKYTPKYNGKVVCIDAGCNKCYTVGKIYQFVDGIITSNRGTKFTNGGTPFASFKEFANWTSAKFIEVVE